MITVKKLIVMTNNLIASKFFLLFVGLFLYGQSAQSQTRLIGERSVYTQYFLSPYLLNPGAAGQQEYSQVMANYRNTWASFPGSPRTATIAYDGAIGNRIGLGLIGVSDNFAALGTTKAGVNLSYTIETPTNKLGVGIGAEYIRHKLRGEELINPLVNTGDPEIVRRLESTAYFDATFGVYGIYNKKIIYGVAFPSVISQRVSGAEGSGADTDFSYIVNLGYRAEVPEYDLVFEPSIYVKKLMLVPLHVDVNLKADFLSEKLTTGITYSKGAEDRVGFLVGTQVNNFGFHYSYNMSLHEFQQYNNGSHEISVRLRIQGYNRDNNN